ncbi:MAG TPA: hypothetical protein G4O09_00030 [Dehalococcoidia bacterium]|jgi:hypothetical protein|nr:hypothetical protein [Dehalococcoidia bacterium]
MVTEISRGRGKLYQIGSEQFVDDINYQLHEDQESESAHWWGEFTLMNILNIRENERYVIELEDGRRGGCYVKKLVNRVVRGVPPRYLYHFTSTGPLE